MKKVLLFLALFSFLFVSCSLNNVDDYKITSVISDDFEDYYQMTFYNDRMTDVYEYGETETKIYKFQSTTENKFYYKEDIYEFGYTVGEKYLFSYNIGGKFVFEEGTYLGLAGKVKSERHIFYNEKDNFIRIDYDSKNLSLDETDFTNYNIQLSTCPNTEELNTLIRLYTDYFFTFSINSYSFYIDANEYTNYVAVKNECDDQVRGTVNKVPRDYKISADYIIGYGNQYYGDNVTYKLGGENNLIRIQGYKDENSNDIKYIPVSPEYYSSISAVQIDGKNYIQESNNYAEAVLQIEIYYDYKTSQFVHSEFNYRPYEEETDVYKAFIKQGNIKYTIDGLEHIVNPKIKVFYSENNPNLEDLLIFVVKK